MIQRGLVVVVVGALAHGCGTWTAQPPSLSHDVSAGVAATVTPVRVYNLDDPAAPFECFLLTVRNDTDSELEVDWDRTQFVDGGQTSGGFMFEGVVYKDRNNPKAATIVLPHGALQMKIWPNNLVYFSSAQTSAGWVHSRLKEGKYGVHLTLVQDGKRITHTFTFDIAQDEK